MAFQRARSQEQKDLRVQQIVDAAICLYEKHGYEDITLVTIAQELSFTRGNLYKYFCTKEEIFLKVIEQDFVAWVQAVDDALGSKKRLSTKGFAKQWATLYLQNTRLIELLSILFSVIEKNVSVNALAEFKTTYYQHLPTLAQVIQRHLPSLTDVQVNQFMQMQCAFSMGLYPMTQETEVQRQAIDQACVPHHKADFVGMFTEFIVFTAQGLSEGKSG